MITVKSKIITEVEKYGELLYLSIFGSRLYGTDNPNSDTDIKGVYLPNKETMILGKHFNNRNIDSIIINDIPDRDIEIYSLQYFLKLCSKGDVGALDLLFSYTSEDSVLLCQPSYKYDIIDNSYKLFNRFNTGAFMGYSQSQALKYGIKSEKLECIKDLLWYILKTFNNYNNISPNIKINDVKSEIKEYLEHREYDKYCYFIKDDSRKHRDSEDLIEYLYVCGKKHQTTISILELIDRLSLQEKSYGKRTEKNIDTNNIDWKGLSHALRVIFECQELVTKGKINFPLDGRYILKKIKEGKLSLEEVTEKIKKETEKVYEINKLYYNVENIQKNKVDKDFLIDILKVFYRLS